MTDYFFSVRPGVAMLLLTGLWAGTGFGQAGPTVSSRVPGGLQAPRIDGTLRYALTASERYTLGDGNTGYSGSSTNFSGNVAYLSNSEQKPFAMIYSGGYLVSTSGNPSSWFHSLSLSQGLTLGRWSFSASDSVSYLPQTPSVGLSGIPGVGDVGVAGTDTATGLGILTTVASRVSNNAAVSVQRHITGKTSLSGSGTWAIQRFLSSSTSLGGLDTDNEGGSASLSHRIDARSSISGNYGYSTFSYSGVEETAAGAVPVPSFISQQATVQYTRHWTRKLTTDASIGPQRVSSTTALIPTSLNVSANFQLNYTGKVTNLSAGYSRGTSSGSGVVAGGRTDSVQGSAGRKLGRDWSGAATAGYSRTTGLASTLSSIPFVTQGLVLGTQANRNLGRNLSIFLSYNLQRQSTQGTMVAFNTFSGVSHIVGAGLTYSPRMMHLGRP